MDRDSQDKPKIQPFENLIEDFELLDDIPTLTSLANDKDSIHQYDANCTCVNCCAHRVILATSQANQHPRITQPKNQKPSQRKEQSTAKPKKDYGDGIKMSNITFTDAWADWEIDS